MPVQNVEDCFQLMANYVLEIVGSNSCKQKRKKAQKLLRSAINWLSCVLSEKFAAISPSSSINYCKLFAHPHELNQNYPPTAYVITFLKYYYQRKRRYSRSQTQTTPVSSIRPIFLSPDSEDNTENPPRGRPKPAILHVQFSSACGSFEWLTSVSHGQFLTRHIFARFRPSHRNPSTSRWGLDLANNWSSLVLVALSRFPPERTFTGSAWAKTIILDTYIGRLPS